MVPALRPGHALKDIGADAAVPFISERSQDAPVALKTQFEPEDEETTEEGHHVSNESFSSGLDNMPNASPKSARPLPQPQREGRPVLRKSVSAMSSLSLKSNGTEKSSLPSLVGADYIRPQFGVTVTVESGIREVFEVQATLGKGGFGQVRRCQHRSTNELFAIKSMDIKSIRDLERFERELKIFERLRNPYIVSLHQVFRGDSQLHWVMDLCTGGDLRKYLANFWSDPTRAHLRKVNPHMAIGLPSEQVLRYMWQMLAGIAYMHHHRFVHRDIKLANFMLKDSSDNSILQLVDFGHATALRKGERLSISCGSATYMAPEVLRGSYTEKCDIWSLGIVAYMLCNERTPWKSKLIPEIAQSISANQLEPWPTPSRVPGELMELVDWLLTHDYHKRPSAKEVLCSSKLLRKHKGLADADQACCAIS